MSEKPKSQAEILKEALLMEPKNSGIRMSDEQIAEANRFSEDYKIFLDNAKTEREAVRYTVDMLEKAGYKPFDPAKKYNPGDKIYLNNRGHAVLFCAVGKRPLADGVRIIASHIDAPRIDLKQRPLYEESQLALMKTHYYGGVRKYQWVAIPLALHGTIVRKDGTSVDVAIGEAEGDPVFCINDLLPHLAADQSKRTLSEGVKGEELNVLIGSMPFRDDKASELVKLNIMRLLSEKYDIVEADFLSAELSLVPANKAKDVGFDRSMVGSYGHDDRVCAYTSLMATIETPDPEYTWINILADKEETGSNGNTGLDSRFLEYFVADLAKPHGFEGRTVLMKSKCLSADVCAACDPTFPDVHDKRNAAYLNYGACFMKFSGSRGKSSTNDATAEFMGEVRRVLDANDVIWQTSELGKVDHGGGGTVAMYISKLGVDVIDIGVPVLSMHAPFEVVSKCDVYHTYLACRAFVRG
jgi:aspartyl aminopeptidase